MSSRASLNVERQMSSTDRSNSVFTTKCGQQDCIQPNETVENRKETSSEQPAIACHPSRILQSLILSQQLTDGW